MTTEKTRSQVEKERDKIWKKHMEVSVQLSNDAASLSDEVARLAKAQSLAYVFDLPDWVWDRALERVKKTLATAQGHLCEPREEE